MDHSLRHALRQLVRLETGVRTLLRDTGDGPGPANAVSGETDGVTAEGNGLKLIIGDEGYGTLDDTVPWADLG